MVKCPGQDRRYWTEKDVSEAICPACHATVEFFRTDTARRCPHCGFRFKNPQLNLGCAEWCAYADRCLADLKRIPGDCPADPDIFSSGSDMTSGARMDFDAPSG